MLAASALLFVALIVGSASQPACFPWPDSKRVEPVTCYKHSGDEVNPTWKIQTISEMTARSGLTAELLSGFAAFALVTIYNALVFLKKHIKGELIYWHLVDATLFIGSFGFVGLTVWNLRVESTVHTCFTTQTIIAVIIQMFVLTFSLEKPTITNWINIAIMTTAMLAYVVLFAIYSSPAPDGDGYFASKYYSHAYAQFVFFGSYFGSLYYMVLSNCNEQPYADLDKQITSMKQKYTAQYTAQRTSLLL